jgi:hypothetical protein
VTSFSLLLRLWFALVPLAAPAPDQETIFIDLQPKANESLKGPQPGNDLADLPQGKQTFEGIKFDIGEKLISLGCSRLKEKPLKVEGVKVNQKVGKLHILHATHYAVPDDTVIAHYVIHYADKSKEMIEVVYGKDVRDWWYYRDSPEVSRGKIAWKGSNDQANKNQAGVRLYLTTWENPKADKKVVSIDLVAEEKAECALFCVAMSVTD